MTLRPVGDFLAAGGLGDWEIWADGRQRAISRPVGGFEDLAGAGGGCGQLVNLERASHGITGRLAPSRAVGECGATWPNRYINWCRWIGGGGLLGSGRCCVGKW